MSARQLVAGASLLAATVLASLLPIAAPGHSLGSASAATTGTATSLRPAGKYAPAGGALVGGYVNLAGVWEGSDQAEADVASREALLGHKMDINQHYYAWTDSFPSALETSDAAKGRMPLISWTGTGLDSILNGSQDRVIDARAAAVKAYTKPVLLRWNWEMNGSWNPGGGSANNSVGATDGPAKFVAAWKRIHDRFVAAGASNVAWVWCPNTTDVPAVSWNHWTQYYPGDAYVDWVGTDTYNWGTVKTTSTWHGLADTVAPLYSDYSTRKPFILAEWASTEVGGNKAAWITEARSQIQTMFPAMAAVIWFDESKETNWRVDSSPAALTAYKAMAADPYYNTATTPVPPPMPPALTPVQNPPVPGRIAGPLVPAGGALLGLRVGAPTGTTMQAALAARESAAGRSIDIDAHDYLWRDTAPGPLERWDIQNGRIPLVTWRPDGLRLSSLASGTNDSRVKLWAQALKGLGGPVLLRFAPGMNGGASISWSGVANSDNGGSNGTTKFISAWRHVHDVFVAQGATNVVWVWSPDAVNAPGTPSWNTWSAYYPGDTYVDWVGVNGSNAGTTVAGGTWRSLTSIVTPLYQAYATRKPVMIADTATAEAGGSKPSWLADASSAVRSSLPGVAAWVYTDTVGTSGYQLDSSAPALGSWVTLAQLPYFRPMH